MVVAYVLLKVKRGGELSVTEAIKSLKDVLDVSLLYGEYDAIIKLEKQSMEELQTFLVKTLRVVDGVDKTSTLITNNDYGRKAEFC